MKKWISENKSLFVKLCVAAFLIIILIVLSVLKKSVDFCEWYSTTIGRGIITFVGAISKYFPISLAEVTIFLLSVFVIVLIVFIVKDLKKKNYMKAINNALTIVLIPIACISCYFVTSELQYNRKALPLKLYEESVDKSEYYSIVEHFVDDYNLCASNLDFREDGEVIPPYSLDTLNKMIAQEYERVSVGELKGYLNSFTTKCKPMMSSVIFSEFNITGVDFGLLGEANVNTVCPKAGLPMVMAHEIAHVKGVMREGDANLLAMYLLLTSEDYFLRFSGYFWGFYRILDVARYTGNKDDYNQLNSKLSKEIKKCDNYNYKYWKDRDLIGKIGDFINDIYLKFSGEKEGTTSYNDTPIVVDPEREIVIKFSIWQKLYLRVYFENLN